MEDNNNNLTRISTSPKEGLTTEEVNARIAQGLTNKVQNKSSKSYGRIFFDNFCTFFNVLCFTCFFVLLTVIKETAISNYTFVLIFLANSIIGVVQEIRAKKTVEKLSLVKAPTAKVIRNGVEMEIAVSDVVLDDVILLELGNQIPADCVVLEGLVEVNESLLTGESVAVRKTVGDNLMSGSFVSGGKCIARAEKVGKDAYVQTLSEKAKAYQKTRSKLLAAMNAIIKCVSLVIIPIAILSGIVNYNVSAAENGGVAHVPEVIISTVSVVIGMIPAGMFFLTTLSLAVGIIKLATFNTLVQDMYSLEMLARANILCLDKTGTITDGKMTVKKINAVTDFCGDARQIIAAMETSLGDKNQTAIALSSYCKDADISEFKSVSVLPFTSARKLSAVSFEEKGTFVIGAPYYVLKDMPIDIDAAIKSATRVGRRVLLLAHSQKPLEGDVLPDDLTPVATVILEDNIRPEAIQTIQWFKENDVSVRVISGDDPLTVSEIARRAGIDGADKYISLKDLSDEEVIDAAASDYVVFGRVSPEQKALIIKTLRENDNTVAMTGDGVNDILAMKEADCSITVASGSGAARSLAHIVLVDDNFNSMPAVVKEGRRTVNNIKRSASLYLMKTLFTIVFAIISIATGARYPYTTGMMMILELFIIGFSSILLSLQPNTERIKGKFIYYVISHSIPGAVILILNALTVKIFYDIPAFQMSEGAYTTLSTLALTLAGLVYLVVLCKPYNTFRGILTIAISTIVLTACALIAFTPLLENFFHLPQLLPLKDNIFNLGILMGLVIIDFPILILSQKFLRYLTKTAKQ